MRSPSVLQWTDASGTAVERMAVEIGGAIYLAQPSGDGWALTTSLDAPALEAGGEAWASDGLHDPKLVWDGGLELWLTGMAGGTGTVARVRAGSDGTFAWSDAETVLGPGMTSFEDPAPFVQDGVRYVVVRERTADRDALTLYGLDGAAPARVSVVREASDDLFAFDRDEVASPTVVATGSVTRLFFAGRRGLKWSIGELASPNGLVWHEPAGGALVLEAGADGFDALGVRDPAVVFSGSSVQLFYSGLDGGRARVGVAGGPAPSL